jgi:hypothetical protein
VRCRCAQSTRCQLGASSPGGTGAAGWAAGAARLEDPPPFHDAPKLAVLPPLLRPDAPNRSQWPEDPFVALSSPLRCEWLFVA